MQNGFLFHVWHYALHCTVHLQVAVQLPHPLESSCQAALPLLKHLAEMNYRSNDLMRAGLKAYLMGDLWEVCVVVRIKFSFSRVLARHLHALFGLC